MGEFIGPLIPLVALSIPIIAIIFNYKLKIREKSGLNEDEIHQLDELNALAEQMAERIKTLETILDAESPEWREQHEEK